MASRGEERTNIFVLTVLTVGPLTFAFTRIFSLMRITGGSMAALILGLVSWAFLMIHLGLTSDK